MHAYAMHASSVLTVWEELDGKSGHLESIGKKNRKNIVVDVTVKIPHFNG
jgi:hypothetical protein